MSAPYEDRELPVTPLADDGAPVRVVPAWVPDLAALSGKGSADADEADADEADAAARARWEQWDVLPEVGPVHRVDGCDLVPVTFAWWDQPDERDGDVMLHLSSFTDRHRRHIAPALLGRVGTTGLRQLTYLLPPDGCFSYRLVHRPHIPDDVGATRPGWSGIHQAGVPDPRNPDRLPHPHGSTSSVWTGPRFPAHPAWTAGADDDAQAGTEWIDVPQVGADGVPRRHRVAALGTDAQDTHEGPDDVPDAGRRPVLVLLDGQMWDALPTLAALHAQGVSLDVLLVDTAGTEQRGRDLPCPDRAARLVREALAAGCDRLGRVVPAADAVVVAGQSYGGLAAASLAVHHPELVGTAIVQSGSFWFSAESPRPEIYRPGRDRTAAAAPVAEVRGDLVEQLRSLGRAGVRTASPARIVVQVGREEDDMVDGARAFRDAARTVGHDVSYREYRGGHDYAWWRHGLTDALDEFGLSTPPLSRYV
ncbi:enterochelin esterase [Austwickia chelonae]|uniref:Putative esterase n=1 Tax=Austwickia chelonae NBRC 105200 TaxID=1184607 RepID=K6V9Q4_9MICO|nr:alpha/beta hydrolase-fold protein [Austwickia chelonae]GAB78963.1 putative esterase [Austwickia chelonae NBRC 105200]SEV87409.1 enterochelin esterase [Austwickia chelonae]